MSDGQTTEVKQEEKQLPIAISIANDVKENINGRNNEVKDRIIKDLADKIIIERTQLLSKVLEKRKEADKELKKINRPDQTQYDGNGKEIGSSYTKDLIDKIRKAREKLNRIDKAIKKAIEEANYEEIKKLN